MNKLLDVHTANDRPTDAIDIHIDGKPCYLIPKHIVEASGGSDCVGEIRLNGQLYHVMVMPDLAKPNSRYNPTTQVMDDAPSDVKGLLQEAVFSLTSRELQIAHLVAKGLLNKQIADRLNVSVYTVSTHLRRIFTKLGVHNRASLVSKIMG